MKGVVMAELGKLLIVVGGGLLVAGIFLFFLARFFPFLGNLPGDIRLEGENYRVYIPITSMFLISIIDSLILNLIIRLWQK